MHYAPTPTEFDVLRNASNAERLDYFLTRAMESEEVWGLSSDSGWIINRQSNIDVLPVWSYRVLSESCVAGDWSTYMPDSVSLEHFVYRILGQLGDKGLQVEILPTSEERGLVIEASVLYEIFERKLDTVEYFLEG